MTKFIHLKNMRKFVFFAFFMFPFFSNAQWNYWNGSISSNPCLKSASSCLAHYNNNCRKDGSYNVKGSVVTCNMTTGGGQQIPKSSFDLAKITNGKQYIVIPEGTASSSLSSAYHGSNLVVAAIFSKQNPKTNFLIGKDQLKTTQSTNCHGGTLNTCYNYVGGPNWFALRSMNTGDFAVIVFNNSFIGLITAASDGSPFEDVKDAYIYYRLPADYLLYELP